MKKSSKPDIYKPNIGYIDNNEKVYYSFLEDNFNDKKEKDPEDFIRSLEKEGSYMFRKNVIIKTRNSEFDTKIAGRINDKLITMDHEVIPIKNIVDIYEK